MADGKKHSNYVPNKKSKLQRQENVCTGKQPWSKIHPYQVTVAVNFKST